MTTLICLLALATVFGSAVYTVRRLSELGMHPMTPPSRASQVREPQRFENAAA